MIMKRFFTIRFIVLLAITGGLSACSDFFDVAPNNGVDTEKYYNNTNDINGGAFGIYSALAPEVHKLFLWGSARADMVIAGEGEDAYVSEFLNNKVTALNPYTDYGFLYKAIARCNHHLNAISRVKPSDIVTPSALEVFYGEAYFVRAWCYFQLVRTFKSFPLITEELAETAIYVNLAGETVSMKTLDLTDEQLRMIALKPADKQEVWKVIISDLNKALRLLKDEWYLTYYPGFSMGPVQKIIRASLLSTYTLACEVAVWNKQYREASEFADYVLNYKPSPGAAETWSSHFLGTGDAGSYTLWAFMYYYSGAFETTRMQEFTSSMESYGGRYLVQPNVEVLDAIFSEEGDVRRRSSWMRIDRKNVIWKYIGKDEAGKSMRDPYRSDAPFHLLKVADAFLFKGIAENRLGNAGAALQMLNAVRGNRGLQKYEQSQIPLDMISLENMLFTERARESAFEGQRWYDLLLQEEVLGRKNVIAETVSKKYPKDQQVAMYNHLKNPENWYLPVEPERWK